MLFSMYIYILFMFASAILNITLWLSFFVDTLKYQRLGHNIHKYCNMMDDQYNDISRLYLQCCRSLSGGHDTQGQLAAHAVIAVVHSHKLVSDCTTITSAVHILKQQQKAVLSRTTKKGRT